MHAFKRHVKARQTMGQANGVSLRHDPVIDTTEEIVVETLAEGFMLLIVMGERAVELADTHGANEDDGDARVQGLRERVARFQRTLSF